MSDKGTSSQMHVGKAGDYACAVQQTKNTIIICISKGTPQAVVGHISPVHKAILAAGQ